MRHKSHVTLATLAVAIAMIIPAGAAAAASFSITAGQNTTVGNVSISGGDPLKLSVDLYSGWCMTQLHADAAGSIEGIPQTKDGNPKVGLFTVNESFPKCISGYEFKLAGDGPVIAVHLKVWDKSSETDKSIVSRPGVAIAGGGSAVAATEPGVGVNYPNCPAGDNDGVASIWDQNAKFKDGTKPSWGNADWIWSTAYPFAKAVSGEAVTFVDDFAVGGWPIDGKLTITADNAFRASLNGDVLGKSISAGPAFPDVLKEKVDGAPQTGDWGVASQGWQLVKQFDIALKPGDNTLRVTAANEYLWPDDKYLGWNAGAQAYNSTVHTDPNGDDRCINPAGLIYKLKATYYADSDTAWAGAKDFPGGSWATYFTYDPS
jgi:hypothetical protein